MDQIWIGVQSVKSDLRTALVECMDADQGCGGSNKADKEESSEAQTVMVDGSNGEQGVGAGAILINLEGKEISQQKSLNFERPTTKQSMKLSLWG